MKLIRFSAWILLSSAIALAQDAAKLPSAAVPADRMNAYADLAVQWMQAYLRVNTSNPPGNEMRAVDFYRKVFEAEGIEYKVFEFDKSKDRGNIIAWLKGSGAKRPLILLNHEDVVTSDPKRWTHGPFSGDNDKGYLWGRGAQDMKGEGLAQLVAMVMLKREKAPLDRDVIFLATADEEAEGTGTDWMIANQKELFGNAEYLLTEGGYNERRKDGSIESIGIDVAEKSPFWLKVTAHGKPGHGSHPLIDSAPNRLVRALNKLIHYQTPLVITPVVDEYMKAMEPHATPERKKFYREVRARINDPAFRAIMAKDDENPQFRNTITLSMLGGSKQTNVIPGDAWANLDVRLLPGQDPKAFLEEMRKVVDDPNVSVEPLSADFRVSNSSSTKTELWEVIKKVEGHYNPGAPVAPGLTSGYTENQRYRTLGINSYGWSPYNTLLADSMTEHGDDERIEVEQVRQGFRLYYDVILGVAGKR